MTHHLRTLIACCHFALALSAQGQQVFSGCANQGTSAIAFGSVSMDRGSDASGSVTLGCQSASSPGYLRYCLYLPEGSPIAGIAPRRMTNYNGSSLAYDLYSDPARTNVIGPPPSGGGFPLYTGVMTIAGNYSQSLATIPIYGRVSGGQNVPAGFYQSQLPNTLLTWAFSTSAPPSDCSQGQARGNISFYFNVTAEVANTCRIGMATDLDFGSAASLAVARQSTSTITLRCPAGTPWSVALGNGANSLAEARRMRSAAGSYVGYELFKDAAHSQRWGPSASENVTGVGQGIAIPQTLTVRGRVPPQGSVPAGSYTDSVLVTLTY